MPLSIIVLLLAAAVAISIAVVTIRRRTSLGASSLIVFASALIVWTLSQILFWMGVPPNVQFWLAATYIGATIAPAALLTFVFETSLHGDWSSRRIVALLAIEPALTQVLLWTDPLRGLIFDDKSRGTVGEILTSGPWFLINAIYSYSLVLIAIILLFKTLKHRPRAYRLRSRIILAGAFIPILTQIINLAGLTPIHTFDLTPVAFILTGLTFTFGLFYDHLFGVIPIERENIVEMMTDGWMILDAENRITDLNPAAEDLIDLRRDEVFGKSAEDVLIDWPNLIERYGNVRESDMKGSVKMRDEWRYLNIRVSPLTDRIGHHIGQLVVWRDITERRKVEEARQHAQDEMSNLLHVISGAASRAQSLEDFLTVSLNQIVYSFQSQSSVIFLLEDDDELETRKLVLAAHHGLSTQSDNSLASMPETNDIFSWVLENREPILIPDISTDLRVPVQMQGETAHGSFLIVPMATEDQILGVICLVRSEGPAFAPDEIARLYVIVDEMANLIYSDRLRHLAIVMGERQRLVRDLHDSVTQKLYGLVTLTEAAQAGLEAGSADMPAQVLARIGENARQALKEMRLFLHELAPVDLENLGLVAVLHQRLSSVEGRADVKSRLLADEDLSIPLDKEVALYYIAQEALNNVLKHANAKSVTIHLKQEQENVILEIEDDGRGFDPQKVDFSGMGLRNMQERASQIGGRLKMISTPGQGTKISVTVSRD